MSPLDESHTPLPGSPYPLGATVVDGGTQFSVHSPDATAVQICLIDDAGNEKRVDLRQQTYGIWHGVISGVGAGQRYGIRADGPWNPRAGLRFNPNKLLIDPWARRIEGELGDSNALRAYKSDPFGEPSASDSLGQIPLSVVTAGLVASSDRLETPWEETVIYELHVGAFTATHPDVPPAHRGTYLGLAAPAVIEHLILLGVTAVELLPVQAFLTEQSVRARGMRNHWGYSTASYFAPHPGYAASPGNEVPEFRIMVDALHRAGIEVILDVVYNHTCEQGVGGISVSWRGLDAPGYYLLSDEGHDIDLTGCGNTVDASSPISVRMITDSLRYWAGEMGVDGFRFDLASALGRPRGDAFDPRASVLTAISSDPILTRCKLIAEPWDATADGYQVGNFGLQWSEWNDKYRSSIRTFWNGGSSVREVASRLAGSEDIFAGNGRRPWASINFITAHDGFTAADLVSYNNKHNDANGEDNRDGADHNDSFNHGIEGDSDDPAIIDARCRHVRALLATLILSTGTPMLTAGDEFGHSLGGNNNTYCVPTLATPDQSWPLDWTDTDEALISFVARALALRRSAPALRQPEFFEGRRRVEHPDLVWFDASGTEFDDHAWYDERNRTVQAWIDGADVRSHTAEGRPLGDSSWLLILHSGGPIQITVGTPEGFDGSLSLAFDSSSATGEPESPDALSAGATLSLTGPTVLALRASVPSPVTATVME
ncbi:glycogen debranching protein GlgX [Rhodococcus sp. IEGM 1379]|nr:glycogen debranching protein GlgX [Rhodococcus sp. IEGM 1379]MDI9917711.1 glycogen debranching protein GlgX [Rhodococcus sp. IEGM 1379]